METVSTLYTFTRAYKLTSAIEMKIEIVSMVKFTFLALKIFHFRDNAQYLNGNIGPKFFPRITTIQLVPVYLQSVSPIAKLVKDIQKATF